jgi:hypothetical protein
MAGLEGDFKTPFGSISKKSGVLIGLGAAAILGISYYRAQKNKAADAVASAGASVGIDPATGFVYGSAEDAAALANQNAYISPGGGGGGGGSPSGGYPSGTFTNNAQWVQSVLSYMQTIGTVDIGPLSAALGKYITGEAVTADEKGLIEQAIAVQGFPPVAGPAGYPPSINTTPTGTTNPPPPPNTTPKYASVLKFWHVDQWINDVKAGKAGFAAPTFSWEVLQSFNPGVSGNIKWHKNSAENYFLNSATYRVV